jgi:hypothetical protein
VREQREGGRGEIMICGAHGHIKNAVFLRKKKASARPEVSKIKLNRRRREGRGGGGEKGEKRVVGEERERVEKGGGRKRDRERDRESTPSGRSRKVFCSSCGNMAVSASLVELKTFLYRPIGVDCFSHLML